MADESAISWTDATFNPWIGCEKVSPACARCYAETFSTNRMGLHVWGREALRRITATSTWRKPVVWARKAREGLLPNGEKNRDGHRPRVFCASMADVFEERPDLGEPRLRLFDLIEQTPELDWLILTKRPEFARSWLDAYYSEHYFRGVCIPLPNVWMGVSVENARFTWRADILREIPATRRFISAEPLLGSLFPRDVDYETPREHRALKRTKALDLAGIDWLIVGGESGGRKSRPMRPEWARELRDACIAKGLDRDATPTAFHFKQWGSYGEDGSYRGVSPKSGGNRLDGVEWLEFPMLREAVAA